MLIPTKDGSFTIKHPIYNTYYHSINGALQESMHVFIESGLHHYINSNPNYENIAIFEMGFGTGLNAFLTAVFSFNKQIGIQYDSIDINPLLDFDYNQFIKSIEIDIHNIQQFNLIHQSSWNKPIQIHPFFKLHKIHNDILNFKSLNYYDIVYFDAFSPNVQPEIWSMDSLNNMYNALKMNGCLVTYCAQGQFKRNLKELGFKVDSIPGPIGKREMIRAIKVG